MYREQPAGCSAARAPACAQVMQRAHAAAAAAAAAARNATEHRAGGYNQGAFPGSLPVLNRTVNGSSSVVVGNGTFPASEQTTLHQARTPTQHGLTQHALQSSSLSCPCCAWRPLCSAAHMHFPVLGSVPWLLPRARISPAVMHWHARARRCWYPARRHGKHISASRRSPQASCELQIALV